MHSIERSLMSGLTPGDHDLLQPATKRPSCTAVNEIHEFECKDSIQEMQAMQKSLKLSMITLSAVLNMYVLAVINYGIVHLSERVKQTNILNVSRRCLKHV